MSSAILLSTLVFSSLLLLVSGENVRCPDEKYDANCVLRLESPKIRRHPQRGSFWPIYPFPNGLNYSNYGLTELILASRQVERKNLRKPVSTEIKSFDSTSVDVDVDGIPYIDLYGVPSLILSNNNITAYELMYILHDQRFEDSNNTYILYYLDLSHLNISWLPGDIFEFFTRLEVLRLNNNPINMEFIKFSIKPLESLQELDISGCGLQHLPFDLFKGLRLRALNLNNNLFTSVPNLNYLSYSLLKLSVDNNPISFLDDTSFRTLHFIEEISAENCSIQGITGGTFSTNDNLRKLNLKNNSLHYLLPSDIPWRSTWISLENNPWDCSCRNLWLMRETHLGHTNLVNPHEIRCITPAVFKHWPLYDVFEKSEKQDECKEFFNEFVELSGMPTPPHQQDRQGCWLYEKTAMMSVFIIAALLAVFAVVLRKKCIHSSKAYLVYNILQHQNRVNLCEKSNVNQHI